MAQSRLLSLLHKSSFLLYKKDTCILAGILLILHITLAPWCFFFYLDDLAKYHIAAALLTALLIFYSRIISSFVQLMVLDLEALIYGFIMTFWHDNPCGTEILALGLMSYLFVIVIVTHRKSISSILATTLTTNAVIIIMALKYSRCILGTDPLPDTFYLFHSAICCSTGIVCIIYSAIQTKSKINRYHKKSANREAYLLYSANHDALTSILNRRNFTSFLHEIQERKDSEETLYCLSIFDIDGFKKINDTYGHDCGDVILHDLSQLIKKQLPSNTVFARWGGEEFIIFFLEDIKKAPRILENIRISVDKYNFIFNKQAVKVSITLGLSSPGTPENFDKMLIEADKNLMYGKKHGKNQVVTSETANE